MLSRLHISSEYLSLGADVGPKGVVAMNIAQSVIKVTPAFTINNEMYKC